MLRSPAKDVSRNHLLSCSRTPDGDLVIRLSGEWKMEETLPSPSEVLDKLSAESRVTGVRFDSQGIAAWDSGLLTFLRVILDDQDRPHGIS